MVVLPRSYSILRANVGSLVMATCRDPLPGGRLKVVTRHVTVPPNERTFKADSEIRRQGSVGFLFVQPDLDFG